VGKTVENIAKICCKENMNMEMNDALLDRAEPDDNGLIGIPVSYDMGLQKRRKGHNSLTGQRVDFGMLRQNET
jgi:hypothetical protein